MKSSFRKSLPRRTFAAGTIVKGRFIEGAPTDTAIFASVQPLKAHEIMQLPEGRRNSKSFWLFTDTKLNVIDELNKINPDLITIDSELFEVFKIEPWQNNVIPHFKVMVMKKLET